MISIGCSSGNIRSIQFDKVGGDVWIRSIASDNQKSSAEGTSIDFQSVPYQGNFLGRGIVTGSNVSIKDVSGSLYIEEVGNRNQNQDVEKFLQSLYIPGDPLEQK